MGKMTMRKQKQQEVARVEAATGSAVRSVQVDATAKSSSTARRVFGKFFGKAQPDRKSDWKNAASSWRKYGQVLSYFYIGAAFVCFAIGGYVVSGHEWPWPMSECGRAVVAGLFAVMVPIYFALEYSDVKTEVDLVAANDTEKETAKEALGSLKAFQESLSKIWIAVAAGIAFLYVGDYPKKPSPAPVYRCLGANAASVCDPLWRTLVTLAESGQTFEVDVDVQQNEHDMPEQINGLLRLEGSATLAGKHIKFSKNRLYEIVTVSNSDGTFTAKYRNK